MYQFSNKKFFENEFLSKLIGLGYKTEWHIAIREGEAGLILKDYESVFHVLEASKNHWCADPFLFVYSEKIYIFVEYYDVKIKKGAIGYAVYDPCTKKSSEWKEIIVENFHLSFPFIYEEGGHIYIIPATLSGNFIRYKAIRFPDLWEREILLKNIEFADTVIYKSGEHYIGYTLQRYAMGKDDRIERARMFILMGEKVILEKSFYSEDPRVRRSAGGGI